MATDKVPDRVLETPRDQLLALDDSICRQVRAAFGDKLKFTIRTDYASKPGEGYDTSKMPCVIKLVPQESGSVISMSVVGLGSNWAIAWENLMSQASTFNNPR